MDYHDVQFRLFFYLASYVSHLEYKYLNNSFGLNRKLTEKKTTSEMKFRKRKVILVVDWLKNVALKVGLLSGGKNSLDTKFFI